MSTKLSPNHWIAYRSLPLSAVWGDGTVSSSDGQRFSLQASALLGALYPRYVGYYDRAVTVYTPVADQYSVFHIQIIAGAIREATRRQVARLRAQRAHVLSARSRAQRRTTALRALHYRMAHNRGLPLPSPNGRAAIAVRAALSRLGRPYVWGATGPDQFDCSGLVQWSYAQAGVHLHRTTFQQINDGIPVPRSQVRPGDLVFPHAGHVQMAIGNNLVVEAPYPGASVRISPLGSNVAIRRPI